MFKNQKHFETPRVANAGMPIQGNIMVITLGLIPITLTIISLIQSV